jgi:molybdopterin converting factor small subunit
MSATLGTANEHRRFQAWLKGERSVALVRYWAGARAAAGVTEESLPGATLGEVLDAARSSRGQAFARVLSMCSFVVDEQPVGPATFATDTAILADSVVEVLPPFAGG